MRKLFWVKGVKAYAFSKIDSTNNEAKRRIKKGQKLPALFIAKSQTAGKGTRGRSFYSAGGGLYMSLAIGSDKANLQMLTLLAAVATAKSIEKLSGREVGIKWVNDIYIEDKKVCGILCEKTENAAVIGIGINLSVKQFPDEIKDIAVNLGKINRKELAKSITAQILDLLSSNRDFMSYYREKSILVGKEIAYVKNGALYTGTALNIDDSGALVVEDEEKNILMLTSGDVTLLAGAFKP